jgi:hypothetical protein
LSLWSPRSLLSPCYQPELPWIPPSSSSAL